jgi:hypothetical protein
MQVKLPTTLASQHWTLVSVGKGRTTIPCPDSRLVLKCAILQQVGATFSLRRSSVRVRRSSVRARRSPEGCGIAQLECGVAQKGAA